MIGVVPLWWKDKDGNKIKLWESPKELGKTEFMTAAKAQSILKLVGTMKPYILDAEVKFEYSNATFHTAQLFVSDFEVRENNLIIKLAVEKTDCKAKELCVSPKKNEVISSQESYCALESGCC